MGAVMDSLAALNMHRADAETMNDYKGFFQDAVGSGVTTEAAGAPSCDGSIWRRDDDFLAQRGGDSGDVERSIASTGDAGHAWKSNA
jgi:hypothetical protein